MSLNRVQLLGGVGADPEVKIVNGVSVATFRIATSEKYTDRNGTAHENTDWHSCVAWRNTADLIQKYVHKGDKLYVEGKLKTREYEKNGETRYVTEVLVDKIEFCSAKKQGESQAYNAPAAPDDMPDF